MYDVAKRENKQTKLQKKPSFAEILMTIYNYFNHNIINAQHRSIQISFLIG